jgi:hypothetical protein
MHLASDLEDGFETDALLADVAARFLGALTSAADGGNVVGLKPVFVGVNDDLAGAEGEFNEGQAAFRSCLGVRVVFGILD